MRVPGAEKWDDLRSTYLPRLPADRGAQIVDIGCGEGRTLAFLESEGYPSLLGLDVDAYAVAHAQRAVNAPVERIADLAEALRDRPAAFDVVIARHVIYYFSREQQPDYLRAMHDCLRPGGLAIVEVFNGAAYTGPYVAYKDHGIRSIFTERSLRLALEGAGFVDVTLAPTSLGGQGIRRRAFGAAATAWQTVLRGIYLLERGLDPDNPRILSKSIVATARRPK